MYDTETYYDEAVLGINRYLFGINANRYIHWFFKIKLQTSLAGSDSCEVTTSTVQVVDGCPDSEEKWNKAAERKNCSAYASQCDEPNKLVYHCVINEYVSQTLEVCAYVQNIVLGRDLFDCYIKNKITAFSYKPPLVS